MLRLQDNFNLILHRILLIILILIPISLSAQNFKAGVRAGIAGTQISGDELGGFDKAGIVAGGFVTTRLTDKLDVGFEILYFQKGSRKKAKPDIGDYITYLLRLNYFEVPVLLHWKLSKRFTIDAGPTVGALISSREEDEYGEITNSRPFNKYEIGIMGGLSVKLANRFYFNFRGANSLLPVREHVSGVSYRLNHGQYNSSLLFTLHYSFETRRADKQ